MQINSKQIITFKILSFLYLKNIKYQKKKKRQSREKTQKNRKALYCITLKEF